MRGLLPIRSRVKSLAWYSVATFVAMMPWAWSSVPQGLKPRSLRAVFGTAEAVPLRVVEPIGICGAKTKSRSFAALRMTIQKAKNNCKGGKQILRCAKDDKIDRLGRGLDGGDGTGGGESALLGVDFGDAYDEGADARHDADTAR